MHIETKEKVGITVFVSGKMDLKPKMLTSLYIAIKASIYQKDIKVINIYSSEYMQFP